MKALVPLLLLAGFAVAQNCQLSSNPYAPDSTSNPYSVCGSPYSPISPNNPYSQLGSPYSPTSVNNPYATDAPKLFAPDGTYLGRYSANPYDPDSTSNQYGTYGSPYSPYSINNPYSRYGNPYSWQSSTNPYAISAPVLVPADALPQFISADDDDPE